ncbi:response regulator transcription factor [Variovorax sp. E3]|jgi:DNA-binding response OmpR family regulator|uniref:response regulator transcription factor n=1 Tax=Variovorax sp. E3 TaxID=1914993 RepID=UPI0022B62823|nr:response regulator transcription factor [Variovorax sp. E3]
MDDLKPTAGKELSVYLIEDEEDLQEALVYSLNQMGFKASGFGSASAFYRAFAVSRCDIVVIDVELPGEDGFSVASHLRSASDVGIVFATARGTLDDRVRGMRGGADAYLVKPVHPEELAATLEAVHRRMGLADASAPDKAPQAAPAGTGHWALTEGNWLLCDPKGQHIRLTTSERAVMTLLFKQKSRPVDRARLASALGDESAHVDLQRVDAIVSRLRRKALAAGIPLPLHAVRGTGYEFQG